MEEIDMENHEEYFNDVEKLSYEILDKLQTILENNETFKFFDAFTYFISSVIVDCTYNENDAHKLMLKINDNIHTNTIRALRILNELEKHKL